VVGASNANAGPLLTFNWKCTQPLGKQKQLSLLDAGGSKIRMFKTPLYSHIPCTICSSPPTKLYGPWVAEWWIDAFLDNTALMRKVLSPESWATRARFTFVVL
jgi:hypothetical protein